MFNCKAWSHFQTLHVLTRTLEAGDVAAGDPLRGFDGWTATVRIIHPALPLFMGEAAAQTRTQVIAFVAAVTRYI